MLLMLLWGAVWADVGFYTAWIVLFLSRDIVGLGGGGDVDVVYCVSLDTREPVLYNEHQGNTFWDRGPDRLLWVIAACLRAVFSQFLYGNGT